MKIKTAQKMALVVQVPLAIVAFIFGVVWQGIAKGFEYGRDLHNL